MTNILLCGCQGKMGRVVAACVAARSDCRIAAGVDIAGGDNSAFPVFKTPADCTQPVDVIIDFSHPSALDGLLSFARERGLPAVIATTGLSDEQKSRLQSASREQPLFFSGNMSLGIHLLMELSRTAARVLGQDFDVEIIEKHHNQKLDAPSGTALMLADALSEGLPYEPAYTYERHSVRQKRDKREIGISSVRGGTIVGEHEVLFAGHDEVISLTHTAHSKELFAVGAVNAAVFLIGKPAGLYTMTDLLRETAS